MPPVSLFLPQVTRIPITGPDPYNTLVCVEADTNAAPQDVRKGHLSRWAVTVPTPFRLAGFDQRVPPVFDHSTTAFLGAFGPADDNNWLYAVDTVTGAGFSPVDGSYFVNLNVALLPGSGTDQTCVSYGTPNPDPTQPSDITQICYYYLKIQVTSFVLCYEPPPPAPPPPAPGHLPGRFAALATAVERTRDLLGGQSLRDTLSAPGSVTKGPAGTMTSKGKAGGCGCG